jgi:uncharacterized protein YbjT (DUF2867 family)
MAPVLVTGATGTVGRAVVRRLVASGHEVRAAARGAAPSGSATGAGPDVTAFEVTAFDVTAFDFTEPGTWVETFRGVEVVLLVRPPQLGNAHRDIVPALAAARSAGVQHVVFLSLQGVQRIPVLPHAVLERWLRRSGLGWTFLRASSFMQNLSTTHAADVRDRDAIIVPAGRGRTSFVDAEDVAAVAARALRDPDAHRARIWTPTGAAALTYTEAAEVLSRVLDRPIHYLRPGFGDYRRHARRTLGMAPEMVLASSLVHTATRLGLAAGVTGDVEVATGRPPTPFAEFARRESACWSPRTGR